MIIEKIVEIKPTFFDAEIKALNEAQKVLEKLLSEMEYYDCETVECYSGLTYDISDLQSAVDYIKAFTEISKAF